MCDQQLPQDISSRGIGSRARAIVHYVFDSDYWEYREETGIDVGIDCSFELIENNQWTGHRIYCQIKGTKTPKFVCNDTYISVSMKISTLNYALTRSEAFLLICVDVITEIAYYLPIQEYFIANMNLFDKLNSEQENLTLRIPVDNIVTQDNDNLTEIAKSRYLGGASRQLHKVEESEENQK